MRLFCTYFEPFLASNLASKGLFQGLLDPFQVLIGAHKARAARHAIATAALLSGPQQRAVAWRHLAARYGAQVDVDHQQAADLWAAL